MNIYRASADDAQSIVRFGLFSSSFSYFFGDAHLLVVFVIPWTDSIHLHGNEKTHMKSTQKKIKTEEISVVYRIKIKV